MRFSLSHVDVLITLAILAIVLLAMVARLLRQGIEERQSIAKTISNRVNKFDQEAHNQRMETLRKESEVKYAEQQEYRTTVLKLLNEQSETPKRIEAILRNNA